VSQLFDLSGKKVLVTGASSGIGRAIAIAVSQQGATVVLTGRNADRLAETQQMLAGESSVIAADLATADGIKELTGGLAVLDGVVFNAGIIGYTPVKFIKDENVNSILGMNFTSQVMLTKELVKNKLLAKGASLVYISSISSKQGIAATGLYAASKAAINAYMKVVANELSGQRIRANSICPGLVRTPMIAGAKSNVSEETYAEAGKEYLLGLGEPGDVAGPAVFLLSGASKWMTGAELIVDGGLTLK